MFEHLHAVYEYNRDVISELLGQGGHEVDIDFFNGEVRAGFENDTFGIIAKMASRT